MYEPLEACHFGSKAPTKETGEARAARLIQKQTAGLDVRALRARRRRVAAGRTANSLFGSGEGASLGAGL